MTNHSIDGGTRLTERFLDAPTFEWVDRKRFSAEQVREPCITTLAESMGMTSDKVRLIIQERIADCE
jgi:DNA-directed RNA polymerase sigma subunit (sigma70/sigma32)